MSNIFTSFAIGEAEAGRLMSRFIETVGPDQEQLLKALMSPGRDNGGWFTKAGLLWVAVSWAAALEGLYLRGTGCEKDRAPSSRNSSRSRRNALTLALGCGSSTPERPSRRRIRRVVATLRIRVKYVQVQLTVR